MELYSKEELLKELKKEYSCGGECDHCPEVLDSGSCAVLRCIRRIIDNTQPVEPEKVLIANVTFDEDKLKEIVQTEVIDKIKSGELVIKDERPQGDLADEVWKLYEKHHSHLATHVIEFGDELKELLDKYQKGGAYNG